MTSFRRTILYLLALVIGILVLIGIMQWFRPDAPYTFDSQRVAVVTQMRELGRLETAQFTIEKIIDARTSGSRLQQLLFGDRILLIAHGEVIAGYDLSRLQEKDIQVDGRRLVINLPDAEILVTRIDNERTRVYDRRQGLLSKGDTNLESEARREAEQEIRKAACEAGILTQAGTNARKQLSVMFSHFDYDTVVINAPQTQCS